MDPFLAWLTFAVILLSIPLLLGVISNRGSIQSKEVGKTTISANKDKKRASTAVTVYTAPTASAGKQKPKEEGKKKVKIQPITGISKDKNLLKLELIDFLVEVVRIHQDLPVFSTKKSQARQENALQVPPTSLAPQTAVQHDILPASVIQNPDPEKTSLHPSQTTLVQAVIPTEVQPTQRRQSAQPPSQKQKRTRQNNNKIQESSAVQQLSGTDLPLDFVQPSGVQKQPATEDPAGSQRNSSNSELKKETLPEAKSKGDIFQPSNENKQKAEKEAERMKRSIEEKLRKRVEELERQIRAAQKGEEKWKEKNNEQALALTKVTKEKLALEMELKERTSKFEIQIENLTKSLQATEAKANALSTSPSAIQASTVPPMSPARTLSAHAHPFTLTGDVMTDMNYILAQQSQYQYLYLPYHEQYSQMIDYQQQMQYPQQQYTYRRRPTTRPHREPNTTQVREEYLPKHPYMKKPKKEYREKVQQNCSSMPNVNS